MPLIKLNFVPGINRDTTNYSGEGNWWDSDKVRFRSGFPEKIGGWERSTPDTFIGTCRQMWRWDTTFSDIFLSVGSNIKLYIVAGISFFDITPLRTVDPTMATPDTDNCVDTTDGSTTVTLNLGANHDAATGSYVTIGGVTGTVGGVPNAEINANHLITVIDGNSFSIGVTTAATSTVSGSGGTAITIDFEIAPGNAATTFGYGWGTSTYGRDTWGSSSTMPINLPQMDWWLDNFDNDLVATIRNGAIYYWVRGATADPEAALGTRAILLSAQATTDGNDPDAVPVVAGQVFLSPQDRHLLAFGAVPFGSTDPDEFDPLLIRWADQDNPSEWTPTTTNSAGSLKVSNGSRIICAVPTRQEILVWTNYSLHSLQFLGTTDVFGLQQYETNISILSPRSVIIAASVVYWIGHGKFYAYSGRVDTLPCTILDYVFEDLNYDQADQVIGGTNEEWGEAWWFYCSANSNWNDRYVVYNYVDRIWYFGTMERTAWLQPSRTARPVAAATAEGSTTGYLYRHEVGTDADTEAMEAFIESNDFDIGDGDQYLLTRRIIPDVAFKGSTAASPEASFIVRPRNFPGSVYQTNTSNTQPVIQSSVDVYTNQVFMRTRARQMALKVQSTGLGVRWQLGSPRLDARTDGKR